MGRLVGVSAAPFTYAAHVLGVTAAVLVLIWCIHFRGGLAFEATNKSLIFNGILLIFIVLNVLPSITWASSFNVINYGAKGDGQTDDSLAFLKAWDDACKDTTGNTTVIIPSKNYILYPVNFTGPCKSPNIILEISGNILAPNDISPWKGRYDRWILFKNVNGLVLNGSCTVDGRGPIWWAKSCKVIPQPPQCISSAPTQLFLERCDNLQMTGLKLVNGQRNHISINNCNNVSVSQITISTPSGSPNTDGIDISHSNNVHIQNSIIGDGDDCIAINGGTSNINITEIACGPGHGISIGSLGKDNSRDTVENIHVRHCNFTNTTNGVRIKTWQGGSGYAKEITFEDINFVSVENPIIIDQYYCDKPDKSCEILTSAVNVSDVRYQGLHGTSKSTIAITLNCSTTVACTGIVMEDVHIKSEDPKNTAMSRCINAQGIICPACTPAVDCLTVSNLAGLSSVAGLSSAEILWDMSDFMFSY